MGFGETLELATERTAASLQAFEKMYKQRPSPVLTDKRGFAKDG